MNSLIWSYKISNYKLLIFVFYYYYHHFCCCNYYYCYYIRILHVAGIKCPVCSKFVLPDDIECHLVMCLTKPKLNYNGMYKNIFLFYLRNLSLYKQEKNILNTFVHSENRTLYNYVFSGACLWYTKHSRVIIMLKLLE